MYNIILFIKVEFHDNLGYNLEHDVKKKNFSPNNNLMLPLSYSNNLSFVLRYFSLFYFPLLYKVHRKMSFLVGE